MLTGFGAPMPFPQDIRRGVPLTSESMMMERLFAVALMAVRGVSWAVARPVGLAMSAWMAVRSSALPGYTANWAEAAVAAQDRARIVK